MTISDGFMGTQQTNEMEICLPNHILNIHRNNYNEAFVLSLSTRNTLLIVYMPINFQII